MGLTLQEMEELDEGIILDMMTEASNDHSPESYKELASQDDFDKF